jgi:hypothetical protein
MNAKILRTLSATGAVAALLTGASPAWAHDGRYERHFGYGPRYTHPYRSAVVAVPPVVRYRYAPAPVYYAPPRAYVRAPAYYGPPSVAYVPLGAIGGAVAGAAIGSGLGRGNGRTAAIAIGSVVGAVIGDQLTYGR